MIPARGFDEPSGGPSWLRKTIPDQIERRGETHRPAPVRRVTSKPAPRPAPVRKEKPAELPKAYRPPPRRKPARPAVVRPAPRVQAKRRPETRILDEPERPAGGKPAHREDDPGDNHEVQTVRPNPVHAKPKPQPAAYQPPAPPAPAPDPIPAGFTIYTQPAQPEPAASIYSDGPPVEPQAATVSLGSVSLGAWDLIALGALVLVFFWLRSRGAL